MQKLVLLFHFSEYLRKKYLIMKTSPNKILTVLAVCSVFVFCSCKKEMDSSKQSLPVSSEEALDSDQPGIYQTTAGNYKLVLQPADDKGQDAWIEYSPTNPGYADHQTGFADQFKIWTWTDGGTVIKARTLIRFDELSKIPSTSTIKNATMYLCGVDEGTPHMPEGNSFYPGSPYAGYGPNDVYVQRVTSAWDENTVTWNTMPTSTVTGRSLISPSTSQWNYNTTVDVTKIVRTFVKQPSANYGFLLSLVNENIYHSMGFYASEASVARKRPKLVIVYSN